MISFEQVKRQCNDGRFFAYDNWRDQLFVPPAIVCVWIFVNLGWSGNAVSWLSGILAILGGVLLATNDKTLILLGSLSYILFYFLDYVDGGVARFKKEQSIAGQYIDWMMHIISSISISMGIFIGAFIQSQQMILVPFGILFVLAASLQWDRFSIGWWTICMYRQQTQYRLASQEKDQAISVSVNPTFIQKLFVWKLIGKIATLVFHENYFIFVLPILAILNFFLPSDSFVDFRMILTLLGGSIYFAFVVYEIVSIASNQRLDKAYNKLFFSKEKPELPSDHFFK